MMVNGGVQPVPGSATERLMRALWTHPQSAVAASGNPWMPVVHLVWLVYVIGTPMFMPNLALWRVAVTYLSLIPFLLIYRQAFFGDMRHLPACALAMSLLGIALIPVSTSWSYVIYAGVVITLLDTSRRVLTSLGALSAAFAISAAVTRFPPAMIAIALLTMAVVWTLTYFHRQGVRRDAALRLSQDEVRRLAAMAERERIGRDLHDLLGHTLSLVAIKSELADRLFERDPERARAELRETREVARQALAQVRSAVTGIRSTGLAAELASSRLMLETAGVSLDIERAAHALPDAIEDALAMVLREAVTNIQRHAHARRVRFRLSVAPMQVAMHIDDDGRGGSLREGNGLRGMRERIASIGGALVLDSTPGQGTHIEVTVPLPQAPMHQEQAA